MLRSNVSDHGMRKYCLGIYKHMPGGLEAHSAYFFVRPVAKLRNTIEKGQQHSNKAEEPAGGQHVVLHGMQLLHFL